MELAGQHLGFAHFGDPGVSAEERMRRDERPWPSMLEPLTPSHAWQRSGAHATGCRVCGLRAHAQWDRRTNTARTVWAWRNLIWDSRESAVPNCPPSYRRERGVNPRVVVKPDEGVRGMDR